MNISYEMVSYAHVRQLTVFLKEKPEQNLKVLRVKQKEKSKGYGPIRKYSSCLLATKKTKMFMDFTGY